MHQHHRTTLPADLGPTDAARIAAHRSWVAHHGPELLESIGEDYRRFGRGAWCVSWVGHPQFARVDAAYIPIDFLRANMAEATEALQMVESYDPDTEAILMLQDHDGWSRTYKIPFSRRK
jgi:hypothetical protein